MTKTAFAELSAKVDAILKRIDETVTQPRYTSIMGAAAYCGVGDDSIRRLIAAGKLTPYRFVKGKISVAFKELDALAAESKSKPRTGRGISR